jgi:hypothetical protein
MNSGLALMPVARVADLEAESKKRAQQQNAQPIIQGLAAHVKSRWDTARLAKPELE